MVVGCGSAEAKGVGAMPADDEAGED